MIETTHSRPGADSQGYYGEITGRRSWHKAAQLAARYGERADAVAATR